MDKWEEWMKKIMAKCEAECMKQLEQSETMYRRRIMCMQWKLLLEE